MNVVKWNVIRRTDSEQVSNSYSPCWEIEIAGINDYKRHVLAQEN